MVQRAAAFSLPDNDKVLSAYQGFPPLSADDVAEAVFWCATLPAHVNVNRL
jgi:3-hydroxy acid dehydrogenase/malonic semialdehyde reductase